MNSGAHQREVRRVRNEARKAEEDIMKGNYKGPLHGVPIAVKDLCFTKGVRTMGGTAVLENFVPEFDATVVEKFRKRGCEKV